MAGQKRKRNTNEGQSVEIRVATPEDSVAILRYYKEYQKEHPLYAEPDPTAFICGLCEIIEKGYVAVAVEKEKVIGVIACDIMQYFWAPNNPIMVSIFLNAQHRQEVRISDELILMAQKKADEMDMPLHVSIFSDKKPEIKDRYIRGRGFTYTGGNLYYKGANPQK